MRAQISLHSNIMKYFCGAFKRWRLGLDWANVRSRQLLRRIGGNIITEQNQLTDRESGIQNLGSIRNVRNLKCQASAIKRMYPRSRFDHKKCACDRRLS